MLLPYSNTGPLPHFEGFRFILAHESSLTEASGGVEVKLYAFLSSALDKSRWAPDIYIYIQ